VNGVGRAHEGAVLQRRVRVTLSSLLVVAYVLVTGALCLLLVSALMRDDATEPGLVAIAVALAVVTSTTLYAQRWIRDGVSELLATADARDAAALVALRVGEREEPEVLLRLLAGTVREILGLSAVEIALRPPVAAASAQPAIAARWAEDLSVCVGRPSGPWAELPLMHAGRDFGLVRVARWSRRPGPNDARVHDLVRHIALVVSSSTLREELEASREQLVRTREEPCGDQARGWRGAAATRS
jgi:hypothetical protein